MDFYRLLADAVVLAHLAFTAFVVLGGLLVLRWRRVALVHVPAAAWGVLVEFADWTCPLTPLENWLLARGGAAGYHGDFLAHVLALLYPVGLTRGLQVALGLFALAINLVVYAAVLSRRCRQRG